MQSAECLNLSNNSAIFCVRHMCFCVKKFSFLRQFVLIDVSQVQRLIARAAVGIGIGVGHGLLEKASVVVSGGGSEVIFRMGMCSPCHRQGH